MTSMFRFVDGLPIRGAFGCAALIELVLQDLENLHRRFMRLRLADDWICPDIGVRVVRPHDGRSVRGDRGLRLAR
jgi:hypothetical protein